MDGTQVPFNGIFTSVLSLLLIPISHKLGFTLWAETKSTQSETVLEVFLTEFVLIPCLTSFFFISLSVFSRKHVLKFEHRPYLCSLYYLLLFASLLFC